MPYLAAICTALVLSAGTLTVHAQDFSRTDTFLRVAGISEAGEPVVLDEMVVFTYEQPRYARYVAAAFAHENFETKHLFLARRREGRPDLFYLAFPVEPGQETLEYRLIVDGVWMVDPHVRERRIDSRGVALGVVQLPKMPLYREQSPVVHGDGTVTFRFSFDLRVSPVLETVDRRQVSITDFDSPRISLMGAFNGWDPFMYPLRPDPRREGFYEVTIPLPPGRHYYYFMIDGERVLDPFNRERARDRQNGALVSTFLVTY